METNKAHKLVEGTYLLTIKGNTVTLFDAVSREETKAKCHPDDDFYVSTGVDTCFKRMFEKRLGMTFKDMRASPEFNAWFNQEEED